MALLCPLLARTVLLLLEGSPLNVTLLEYFFFHFALSRHPIKTSLRQCNATLVDGEKGKYFKFQKSRQKTNLNITRIAREKNQVQVEVGGD